MQRKKQACLPLSLMHSERTGGKQATNLVKENEKKQICISVKEECGVWSSVPANSSGIWVAGALAAWLGAMQTVDDAPEPAQRLTKLKFPKPSRNVMGTEEARSSWKAPRCWENGTSILTSSLKPSPSIYWAKASQRQDLVALFRSELPVEVCIRREISCGLLPRMRSNSHVRSAYITCHPVTIPVCRAWRCLGTWQPFAFPWEVSLPSLPSAEQPAFKVAKDHKKKKVGDFKLIHFSPAVRKLLGLIIALTIKKKKCPNGIL
nr:uncharacterized protein LOC106037988 isoform X1 [Anser cygnoides]